MQDAIALVLTHVRMVWRFRWVALASATLLCVIGWGGVTLMPDVYEVETKVFLDTRSVLQPLLKGLAVDDTSFQTDTVRIMRRTLLVRPNLEAVARKTDMDLEARTPEQFEEVLDRLAKDIKVDGTLKENIFVIRYQNSDPRLARRVVESILNIFVERSLGESRKDTSQTKAFLAKQIAEYESRLESAELRMKEFKQRNIGLLPQDGRTHLSRLEDLQKEYDEVTLKLREAERRRESLKEQLGNVDKMFEIEVPSADGAYAPPDPLDVRIAGMEQRLDELLLQYTEQHPDVISLRRVLEDLRNQQAEKEAAMTEKATPADDEARVTRQQLENPLYQQLQVALGELDGSIAALRLRAGEYETRISELRQLIDTSMNVEAELKRLDRDYEVNRRNYEELLKRRESLNISDDVSQSTDNVQFNIIEPPRTPLTPVAPDRRLLSIGVLVAGIGAGIGLALLIALLRPAVYTRETLGEFTSLPVIGTVNRIWTRGELFRRRMEVATFAVGCLCLIAVFAGMLVVQELDIDVVGRLTRIGQRLL